jgi:hypothetical protein
MDWNPKLVKYTSIAQLQNIVAECNIHHLELTQRIRNINHSIPHCGMIMIDYIDRIQYRNTLITKINKINRRLRVAELELRNRV